VVGRYTGTHRVVPLGNRESLELARAWVQRHSPSPDQPLLTEGTLLEAWNLVQQYRSDRFLPGLLLDFLEVTRKRLTQAGPPASPMQVHDFIATLTQLTGLPTSILDERQSLDLAGLQRLFEKRILGQPEAIRCLVERVAMIKAGVTDPSRPQGVFLFAGPTGTGKTEIAKTLAEFLFGSASRMIRIDMSELQTPESLSRLLGGPEGPSQGALVDLVRRQPFSVVLLDEFEKAHPNVWDLFLQVFDDGRLTDRQGNTTDFRSTIIIMTTNLGGLIPSGASVGFTPQEGRFRPENVHRAIDKSFRREFLNRIDRVVVFRPLSRDVMRDILRKQLDEVTRRRGLRNREWAIEWGEDAIEFLLDRGFTPDLGARPLKRAIERYFLSQLATTIVRHEYPKGDQFLFVRAEEDGLIVQFVDPDAPLEPVPASAELADDPGTPRLERITLEPRGTPEEIVILQREFDRIQSCVAAPAWQAQKLELLGRMRDSEFWQSAERFTVLDRAEYLDRVERGTKSAGSLLERLRGSRSDGRSHYPRDLVARLAQQLYLLDEACCGVAAGLPHDAFLLVEAARDIGTAAEPNREFALRIGAMYRAWAAKRRMQLDVMEESGSEGRNPYRLLLAISGYAAYSILKPEDGLHVLEEPVEKDAGMRRSRVRVRVVPQPERPLDSNLAARVRLAAQTFEATSGTTPGVVRRYREQPTPLVRDAIRGWRSGKFEKILGGDFDLIGEELRTAGS
jgi:ATP-dependent Clp protease ATP-binding subunit ClpC